MAILGRCYEVRDRTGVAAAIYAEWARLSNHEPAAINALIRVIETVAYEPMHAAEVMRPKVVEPRTEDRRFCMGLRLGFYSGASQDDAARAAHAASVGDALVALGRFAEATLAYGEAERLAFDNPTHLGNRRWAARAFTTARKHVNEQRQQGQSTRTNPKELTPW